MGAISHSALVFARPAWISPHEVPRGDTLSALREMTPARRRERLCERGVNRDVERQFHIERAFETHGRNSDVIERIGQVVDLAVHKFRHQPEGPV